MDDTESILKGFELGAVDYVSKPFNAPELLARVSTHLRLRCLQKTAEKNLESLSKVVDLRDSLVNMIVHDMRSPLTAVKANLDMADEMASQGDSYEDFAEVLQDAGQAADTGIRMMCDLLDINRMEEGRLQLTSEAVEFGCLLRESANLVGPSAVEREVGLDVEVEEATVSCDRDLIQRVLCNLLTNAIRQSPRRGRVQISSVVAEGELRVDVADSGPGVLPELKHKVFERFGQVEARKDRAMYSSGLSLTFCRLAVETHGGSIGLRSDGENGCRFWFRLPMAKRAEA